MLSDSEIERYSRHIVLKDIGGHGQTQLKAAKIALIGMGGIGAPAALYLAAAGIGTLGLIDDDVVALSNLQRQILYGTDDIDTPKVRAAQSKLMGLNPDITCVIHPVRLDASNAKHLLSSYDLIIDGSDNFATRHCVNAATFDLQKPLISAALGPWEGQLSLFDGSPRYQCFVPKGVDEGDNCAQLGIVGALCGVIGAMAALEAIKWITGAGQSLKGKILVFDGLSLQSRIIQLRKDPVCSICAKGDDGA